jgi:hypothetical protein
MHHSLEKKRKYQEWMVRWRWPTTLLMSFCLCESFAGIAQKRSQWPGLLEVRALTRLGDSDSIEVNILEACIWSYMLIQTWASVGAHRREQARAEQERLFREAASQEGVWPPLPKKPAV